MKVDDLPRCHISLQGDVTAVDEDPSVNTADRKEGAQHGQ